MTETTICPICDGELTPNDRHSPADDVRQIIERDSAYDSDFVNFESPLTRQLTGRMQMAADRRMLLRLIREFGFR